MSTLSIDIPVPLLQRFNVRLKQLGNFIPPALTGILIAVFLWWLGTTPLLNENAILASFSPDACFNALLQLIHTGEIFTHIVVSLQRVLLSLLFALLLGIPLGIAVGLSVLLEKICSPLFQFIRMISPISWMHIWRSCGEAPRG